jgi:hypothetical protein
MAGMIVHHQPLYNWCHELQDELDFEKFKKNFLIPIDEFAEHIVCPESCPMNCDREVIKQYRGNQYEAVCPEWPNKFFVIEEIDALYYKVRNHILNQAIAEVLDIRFNLMAIRGMDDSWRIGEYPLENGLGFPVFLTLGCWPERIMELIIDCRRLTRNGYLLLGTNRHILNQTCEEMLLEDGAKFLPLNESLDFNREAKLYLMQPVNIKEMAVRKTKKEPDNIFRKRGDVWEIRFQGGKKFMLTGVNTGTEYIRYMLERPNTRIPVLDIAGSFPMDERSEDNWPLDFEEGLDGFSIESPSPSANPVADSQAIREYRNEIRRLLEEMETAEKTDNISEIEKLEKEIATVKKAINNAVGPNGQRKILNDPVKNAANSFRNAINRTIEKILRHDETLGEYLRENIICGHNPSYTPLEEIKWHFKDDNP